MKSDLRFSGMLVLPLLLVIACAAILRAGYLIEATANAERDPALVVQADGPLAADERSLIANIKEHEWFGARAPLSAKEEQTAHVAPGFYWAFAMIDKYCDEPAKVWRWINVALGSLTAGCYFFFARRTFHSTLVGTVAGLLTAVYPYWIINTAELNDGVLATFLLSLCLMFGARAGQTGGIFTGLLFGLSLACLVLVRAALLPFAVIALLWFLWESRRYSYGWFAGLLALVGLANGVVLWGMLHYQEFQQPVPIANAAYLHLWIGNHPDAQHAPPTGSTMSEAELERSLGLNRYQQLLKEPNQARRYQMLAHDVVEEVKTHPVDTMSRRFKAFEVFLLGEYWARQGQLIVQRDGTQNVASLPDWLRDVDIEAVMHGTLLGMFVLALLGWRWSYAWRWHGRIAAIAFIWIPLPYLLSHAEALHGPRLPLDGVLLCYAAFALLSLIPGLLATPVVDEPILNADAPR